MDVSGWRTIAAQTVADEVKRQLSQRGFITEKQ